VHVVGLFASHLTKRLLSTCIDYLRRFQTAVSTLGGFRRPPERFSLESANVGGSRDKKREEGVGKYGSERAAAGKCGGEQA